MELERTLIYPNLSVHSLHKHSFSPERSTRLLADAKRPRGFDVALRAASAASSEVANLIQEHGALQWVKLEQNGSDLGDERVGENIVADVAAVGKEFS